MHPWRSGRRSPCHWKSWRILKSSPRPGQGPRDRFCWHVRRSLSTQRNMAPSDGGSGVAGHRPVLPTDRMIIKAVCRRGPKAALGRKHRETPPTPVKFDGDFEARLIAPACSDPPGGLDALDRTAFGGKGRGTRGDRFGFAHDFCVRLRHSRKQLRAIDNRWLLG